MKLTVALAAIVASSGVAVAQEYDLSAAMGAGKIISSADDCGYNLDQSGMDKHLAEAGLNSLEALGFITNVVMTAQPPSAAECTAIRSTAKALGLIK